MLTKAGEDLKKKMQSQESYGENIENHAHTDSVNAPRSKRDTSSGGRTSFNVNNDQCIRWRILEDGYSNQMPISEQK